jgi:hypothetical protein
MARVTKMERDKFSLASGEHVRHNFLFLLPYQRLYIVNSMRVYARLWLLADCIWITIATK